MGYPIFNTSLEVKRYMEYTVETFYPYKFYHYNTLKEAKKTKSELRKQGIKASILVKNENGNDYILS